MVDWIIVWFILTAGDDYRRSSIQFSSVQFSLIRVVVALLKKKPTKTNHKKSTAFKNSPRVWSGLVFV